MRTLPVAGDNSWGARPYPEYSIPAKDYEFGFTLKPVFQDNEIPSDPGQSTGMPVNDISWEGFSFEGIFSIKAS